MPYPLEDYRENGLAFPIQVMSQGEAADCRAAYEDLERRFDLRFSWDGPYKSDPHLLFSLFDRLIRRPALLDPVEAILGADILVWNCDVFLKEPRSSGFISWHQDLHYWGMEIDNDAEVSAWLALSPATLESGCMRMVPGSHLAGAVTHDDSYAADNMLTRGQQVAVQVDEAQAVAVELAPGQASLHHGRMFHASGPNRSDDRRIGVAIRYIRPEARQTVIEGDFATLVRGKDRHGHFALTPPPAAAPDQAALAQYRAAQARRDRVYYRGAEGRMPPGPEGQ